MLCNITRRTRAMMPNRGFLVSYPAVSLPVATGAASHPQVFGGPPRLNSERAELEGENRPLITSLVHYWYVGSAHPGSHMQQVSDIQYLWIFKSKSSYHMDPRGPHEENRWLRVI